MVNGVGLQQGLALAALAEADHRARRCLQMRHGDFGDLRRSGDKADTVLGGGAAAGGLQGDAAHASGVARRRGGQGRLVTA